MNTNNNHDHSRAKKTPLLIVALIIPASLFGWWLGGRSNNTQTNNPVQPRASTSTPGQDAKSLVNYTLPDAWTETYCAPSKDIYITPSDTAADCKMKPRAPVEISIDSANNKDCNQLQNVQNVSKHICISEYINGLRSLKSETVYNKASAYKKDMTINAYYIDTGKGVAKVEYVHEPNDNEFQADFEQLAKSVQVKN